MKNPNKIALTHLKPTGKSAEILSLLDQDPIYEEVEEKVEQLEEKIKSLKLLQPFDPEDLKLSVKNFCEKYYGGSITSDQGMMLTRMIKQWKLLKEHLEYLRNKSSQVQRIIHPHGAGEGFHVGDVVELEI